MQVVEVAGLLGVSSGGRPVGQGVSSGRRCGLATRRRGRRAGEQTDLAVGHYSYPLITQPRRRRGLGSCASPRNPSYSAR
jgi:hypothetical protein